MKSKKPVTSLGMRSFGFPRKDSTPRTEQSTPSASPSPTKSFGEAFTWINAADNLKSSNKEDELLHRKAFEMQQRL